MLLAWLLAKFVAEGAGTVDSLCLYGPDSALFGKNTYSRVILYDLGHITTLLYIYVSNTQANGAYSDAANDPACSFYVLWAVYAPTISAIVGYY